MSKNKLSILLTLFAVLAIALVVLQVQKQQTVKQQAAGNSSPIYLSISPDDGGAIGIGDKPQVTVNLINTNTLKKITALDMIINYDSDTLELLEANAVTGSNFTEALRSQTPGTLHCVLVNLEDRITLFGQGNNLPVLRLKFNAKKASSGTISAINASFTVFGGLTTSRIADNTNESYAYQIYATRMAASALGSTINGIDTIIAALEAGKQSAGETFTGFGVLNWFNMVQIFETGNNLENIDDQIALYTAIRNDMGTSGKNIEEILNTYRSFRDSKGKINQAGKDYFNRTYGSIPKPGILLQQYDQECTDYIETKVEEDPANAQNSAIFECQAKGLIAKNDILDFRTKEEKIIKNSINPLTLALEKFDKALRNSENTDDLTAEIYYQTAALLQTKTNDDLAVEFYSLVAHNYSSNNRSQDAKDKVAQLAGKGHQAWMLGSELFISLFSIDNFIPIGPIGTTGKVAVKTATAGEKTVLKAALSASKKDSKKVVEILASMGMKSDKARQIGIVIERIAAREATDKASIEALNKELGEIIIKSQETTYSKIEIEILNKFKDLDFRFHMKDDFQFLLNKNPEFINNYKIRKNLLEFLGSRMNRDSVEDIIKNGLNAKQESVNEFVSKYLGPEIEYVKKLYPERTNLEEYIINERIFNSRLGNKEGQLKAAKKAFLISDDRQKYTWYQIISEFIKDNSNQPWGGKINADKFFVENKTMLFGTRLKAIIEARARLLVNLQKFNLSVAKDRQFLANTLNKAFGIKTITADDLKGAEILTPEKAAMLSGTELPPYGIPILVASSTQEEGDYILRSSLIQSKLGQGKYTVAVQAVSDIKPFSDVGGVIVSTDTKSLLHEVTHSYWAIIAGDSLSVDGRILNEVNSYFIEGKSFLLHIDNYMGVLRKGYGFIDEQTCKELTETAEAAVYVLTEAGISKLQMQDILLNTGKIKELEVYLKMTDEELADFVKNYPK